MALHALCGSSVERTRPSDPPTYTLGPNPVWEPDSKNTVKGIVTCSSLVSKFNNFDETSISGYLLITGFLIGQLVHTARF